MTQEEKARAYDEAIERAKLELNSPDKRLIEYIFPELKESEDEKIRKAIYNCVKWFGFDSCFFKDVSQEECLAWLEKQGGHAKFIKGIQVGDKVTRNEDGVLVNLSQLNRVAKKQGEQKPTDKVEPKFRESDWLIYENGSIYYVNKVYEHTYELVIDNGDKPRIPHELIDKKARLWTIKDAKDGDVLYLQKDVKDHIIIYKGVLQERFRTFVSAYCAYNGIVDAFCFADVSRYVDIAYGGIMPATKEQRDLLFQKMKEAGYEWDAEKKELSRL